MSTMLEIPPEGAPRREYERVIALLNSVTMTMDQVERGYDAYLRADRVGGYDQAKREQALLAFCEAEGLAPAPAAALAIVLRADVYISALSNGYDIKNEDPERFETIATDPFTLFHNYDCEIVVGEMRVIGDDDSEPDPDQFDFFPALTG